VGSKAGLDTCGKSRPHRDSIPGPSSPWRAAVPTELLRTTTNDETEFRLFNFSNLIENSKINCQPTGNREKNSSIGKKFERVTGYRLLTPTGRRRLNRGSLSQNTTILCCYPYLS